MFAFSCFFFFYSAQKKSGLTSTRAALNPFEFNPPSHTQHPAVPSCLRSAKHPDTSSHQSKLISTGLPSLSTQDSLLEAHSQDLLLPPSAFMIPGNQNKVIIRFDAYQKAFISFLHNFDFKCFFSFSSRGTRVLEEVLLCLFISLILHLSTNHQLIQVITHIFFSLFLF